jgi:glucose/mannose transport system permease protein
MSKPASAAVKFQSPAFRAMVYGILVLLTLLFLIPVYVVLATGLKSFQEASLATMWRLPSGFNLQSFAKAWRMLAPSFKNSFAMAIPSTIITSLLGALNGYVLSKWKFRGANTILLLIVFGMFIPYQSIIIPLVRFLQSLHLYGGVLGLTLVHIIYGIPIPALIFRNYYAGIPDELIEAARIDGADILQILRYIMLPLSVSGFVVVAIFQFTNIWNDFLFAVTVTSTQAAMPVTVFLQNLAGSFVVEWNVQMAGAMIAALPTVLIYIFLGQYFIRGMLAGSIKG